MPSTRLRKGLHFLLNGREYIIDQRLPNRDIRIRDIASDTCIAMTEEALTDAVFDGHLEFLIDDGNGTYRGLKDSRLSTESLSLLDGNPRKKWLKEEAKRRYKYVREVLDRRLTKFTDGSLTPIINKISQEINDPSPPSTITLYRWSKLLLKCGDDIRLLVPLTGKRGNRTRKFGGNDKGGEEDGDEQKPHKGDCGKADEVADIVNELIKEVFLTEERPSVETTYDLIVARITKLNRRRAEEDKLPVPVRSSVYEVVSKIPEYEKDIARYGRRYADLKHKSVKQGPRPTRPLERVEMDDTKLDLFVIDPERCMPIGRATLFTAIDRFTSYPTGIDLSFNAPGYLSVMNCLLHAIKKKVYIKERYPEIKNDWLCYGVMESLVVDNAKQYWSESLEDAALELNFLIEYSPVRAPWYKAAIERFFGTINRQLLHHQPGTTFSDIFAKKDYDPKKNAVISLQTLLKLLHIFIVDIFAQEEHDFDGFDDVPARRWKECIEEFPPAMPTKAEDLDVLIGQVEWRIISNNGVELFGLRYNCDKLATLRSELKGAPAKIKLNPNELSIVHVADLKNGRYIHVPAKNQEYTKGLTLYQHDVIRRHARITAKEYVNIEDLCNSKEIIREIVRQEWEKSRPSDTRIRQARFMNYGYQIKGEGFEQKPSTGGSTETTLQEASSASEIPRLYPESSSREDSSDLGSAFPILDVTHEDSLREVNQTTSGYVEKNASPAKPKPINKSEKSETSKSINTPKQVKHNKAEDPQVSTDVQAQVAGEFDKTGWGAEYD
jgi:putative transposase